MNDDKESNSKSNEKIDLSSRLRYRAEGLAQRCAVELSRAELLAAVNGVMPTYTFGDGFVYYRKEDADAALETRAEEARREAYAKYRKLAVRMVPLSADGNSVFIEGEGNVLLARDTAQRTAGESAATKALPPFRGQHGGTFLDSDGSSGTFHNHSDMRQWGRDCFDAGARWAVAQPQAAAQADDARAQFNGFDITKLPPILISCVAKLWPGSNGLFWESALEKMPERIEQLMRKLAAAPTAAQADGVPIGEVVSFNDHQVTVGLYGGAPPMGTPVYAAAPTAQPTPPDDERAALVEHLREISDMADVQHPSERAALAAQQAGEVK